MILSRIVTLIGWKLWRSPSSTGYQVVHAREMHVRMEWDVGNKKGPWCHVARSRDGCAWAGVGWELGYSFLRWKDSRLLGADVDASVCPVQ